jgi:hypothetical protein
MQLGIGTMYLRRKCGRKYILIFELTAANTRVKRVAQAVTKVVHAQHSQ